MLPADVPPARQPTANRRAAVTARPALDEGDTQEFFQFMAYGWDVTAALHLARDLPVQRLHVEPLYPWLALIGIDPAHAAQADLTQPLLVVRIAEISDVSLVIDGWHRIYRSQAEGRTHLPCRVLDEAQELEVRAFGGRKGSPPRRTSRHR